MKSFHVRIVRRKDCKNLVMRYIDPVDGRWRTSTKYRDPATGIVTETGTNRKFAERLAARWEGDLVDGRDLGRMTTSWSAFRDRYERERIPGLAVRTAEKINTVFNAVERILPKVANGELADLDAEALSRFQTVLRDGERAEDTIKGDLGHLRAALGWAVRQKIILSVPTIDNPPRAKKAGHKSKGRPVTGEEFDRMLSAIPSALAEWRKRKRDTARKVARKKGAKPHKMSTDLIPVEVDPAAVESWRHYLVGLWLSGLRLEESLEVFWNRDDRLCVDLRGRRPMLRIPAELEKGNRDRILPITPDFAEFLLATPEADRHGPVFRPLLPSGNRANDDRAGRMISLVGELARVVVHTDPKTGEVKFASAHDLRRSFGNRWAKRVKTPVLMKLMRHESIETTMRFYVDLDVDEIAEDLFRDFGQAGAGSGAVGPLGAGL